MEKKIVYTYNWWRADGSNKPILSHHETKLMGYTERYILNARKGRITSGKLKFTYKEISGDTSYIGRWSVKYEY